MDGKDILWELINFLHKCGVIQKADIMRVIMACLHVIRYHNEISVFSMSELAERFIGELPNNVISLVDNPNEFLIQCCRLLAQVDERDILETLERVESDRDLVLPHSLVDYYFSCLEKGERIVVKNCECFGTYFIRQVLGQSDNVFVLVFKDYLFYDFCSLLLYKYEHVHLVMEGDESVQNDYYDVMFGCMVPNGVKGEPEIITIVDGLRHSDKAVVFAFPKYLFGQTKNQRLFRQTVIDEYNLTDIIDIPNGALSPNAGIRSNVLVINKGETSVIHFRRFMKLDTLGTRRPHFTNIPLVFDDNYNVCVTKDRIMEMGNVWLNDD